MGAAKQQDSVTVLEIVAKYCGKTSSMYRYIADDLAARQSQQGASANRGEAVAYRLTNPRSGYATNWEGFPMSAMDETCLSSGYTVEYAYAATPPSPAESADSFALMQQALFALWQAPNDYVVRATAQSWLRPEDLAAYKAAQPAASAAPRSGVSDADWLALADKIEVRAKMWGGDLYDHGIAWAKDIRNLAARPQPGRVEGMDGKQTITHAAIEGIASHEHH